jgi:hypothetical protein
VFGNPPFIGQSFQSAGQRAQMARIVGSKRGGSLDYVCAWFLKAGAYARAALAPSPSSRGGEADAAIQSLEPGQDKSGLLRPARNDGAGQAGGGKRPRIAFVSTNSITQGEQVAQLWPLLFGRCGLEIAFGHRTFEWMSDARGKAHVHCVIIGLTLREDEPAEKRLFSYPTLRADPAESRHAALSPYLIDASGLSSRHLVVTERRKPFGDVPAMRMGSKIVDGGHLIFTDDERAEFLVREPNAAAYMCPLIGSLEYINGERRWILSLDGVSPSVLRAMPLVIQRLTAVKAYRLASKKTKTRELADYPTRFEVMTIPTSSFLVVPEVSSERREYVPVGWQKPPTIPSNLIHAVIGADRWDFALITSRMHMAWLREFGGRLKSDYRYSIGLVYNTFPWPEASEAAKGKLRALAQGVLDARAAHPGATLADLYDPLTMPPDLRRAHRALDEAVDRLYRAAPFASDRERVEHLFTRYERLTADLLTAAQRPKRGRRRG